MRMAEQPLSPGIEAAESGGQLSAALVDARKEARAIEQELVRLDQMRAQWLQAGAAAAGGEDRKAFDAYYRLGDELRRATSAVCSRRDRLIERYQQLRLEAPEVRQVATEMADLLWRLLSRAEELGADDEARELLELLSQHDDGRYVDLVEGTGTLELETDPLGADVRLYQVVAEGPARRLVARQPRALGRSPVGPIDLAPGRYLLEIRRAKHAVARRPFVLGRGCHLQMLIRLFATREVGPDYVLVPASRFSMGDDALASGSEQHRSPFVDNFAIGRYPVSIGEYLLFLDELAEQEPERAIRYTPQRGHRLAQLDPRLPVSGVTYEAAAAYAEWMTARTGVDHALPSEEQWEKAARGVDGRAYVWGERYVPGLCHVRCPQERDPRPAPIGCFGGDASVYGVRDLAGGLAEWTRSDGAELGLKIVRGGSFEDDGPCGTRVARRMHVSADSALASVGFRLVRRLGKGGGERVSPPMVPSLDCGPAIDVAARPPVDVGEVRARLLAQCQRLSSAADPQRLLGETLALAVSAARAERGLLVASDLEQPEVRLSRTARGAAVPQSDQVVDMQLVSAAQRQNRTISVADSPTIAVPLPRTQSCLLLDRRFLRVPFDDSERLIAETAASVLAMALRLVQD